MLSSESTNDNTVVVTLRRPGSSVGGGPYARILSSGFMLFSSCEDDVGNSVSTPCVVHTVIWFSRDGERNSPASTLLGLKKAIWFPEGRQRVAWCNVREFEWFVSWMLLVTTTSGVHEPVCPGRLVRGKLWVVTLFSSQGSIGFGTCDGF